MPKNKPLETIIYEMVEDCGRRKTDIAADMGKPLSTFSREVSPFDDGAKLGAMDIIPLSLACRSDAIVAWLADALGYRLVKKFADPDGGDLGEEINQAYEASGEYLKMAREAKVCLAKLRKKREDLNKELDDVDERIRRGF